MKDNLMKRVTITIPMDFYDKIEKLKERSKWSRSLIIREALKDFISKYEQLLEIKS